jgi:putative phosphotransacetylase
MKIPVGISARHIHLTKDNFVKLFGYEELTKFKDIKQPGLFAAEEKVTLKTDNYSIDNVRILGPFREYNQAEISKTDAYKFKVDPKVRRSSEVEGTDSITVVGPKGEIKIPVIIANRHIHITKKQADELNVKDRQLVPVKINSEKPGVILAEFKVSEKAFLELHLDTDDANAFLIKQDDEVEIML